MEAPGMHTPGDALSYIYPIGYTESLSCGYCGRRGKSFSYYARASSLSPSFYQSLVDRTWRRSGTTLYRPDPRNSCCPHYTLRLDAGAFKPTKDQRQAVNRFNRYLTGDDYTREAARLYPLSREKARKRDNEFDLVHRIHEAESSILKVPPDPAHSLTVTLEDDTFTEEKYQVFENYQRVVHKEAPHEISRRSFRRFLCDSPIKRETLVSPDGKERRLGSFHQCYRLDGQLVAIGVLDLLPTCVSAVYFLYHESIHSHNPGKLGALREIALAKECGYEWWYPGFYIHSCPKMRYKIDYSPQYILDPEDLTWNLLDRTILDLLDRKPYVSPSRELRNASSREGRDAVPGDGASELREDFGPSVDESGSGSECDLDPGLFESGMPGIPSLAETLEVNMGDIAVQLNPSSPLRKISDFPNWQILVVAELVAAIGRDLIDRICLDLVRRGQ